MKAKADCYCKENLQNSRTWARRSRFRDIARPDDQSHALKRMLRNYLVR